MNPRIIEMLERELTMLKEIMAENPSNYIRGQIKAYERILRALEPDTEAEG